MIRASDDTGASPDPATHDAGSMPAAVAVHVAPNGNAFMADIASWIAEAATLIGHDAEVRADGSLPSGDRSEIALVVAPHEFFGLVSASLDERRRAAARSIPIATEQPGTTWFEESLAWCRLAPLVFDINQVAVDAARAAGVDARLLRLGAVPSMDRRGEDGDLRPVDVTVLAGLTDVRADRLASLAPTLWERRCELRLFPTDRPVARDAAPVAGGAVFGTEKYELLARTSILLNLHRGGGTDYFEWARAVEAMANGCVVVTEPSAAIEPLVDGTHLVVTDDPAAALADLLADRPRLRQIGDAAADLVHGELALERTLAPLLARAQAVSAKEPPPSRTVAVWPGRRARRQDTPVRPAFRPHRDVRRRLLDAVVAERRLRRDIDAERCRIRHGTTDHIETVDTAGWAGAAPDVSAVITLFDYGHLVGQTLDSLAASRGVDLEIVVVDDHSTDDGRAVVRTWIDRHPDVPVRLLGRDANGGLAAARNLAIGEARTDRVMVVDADNLVYPSCLERLATALDDDPAASFSWSILETFGAERGLLSAFAWDADRLAERNSIDAQVMLRRSAWEATGGYRELPEMLPGWEDWDLWLRIAAAGGHGVHVPEMLGRYRTQVTSMVAGPNRFNDVMLERFEALHPDVTFPRR